MSDSIERKEIDGRQATVVYLKPDFEPGTPDDHTMVKIIYDDGDIEFAVPAKGDEPDEDEEE